MKKDTKQEILKNKITELNSLLSRDGIRLYFDIVQYTATENPKKIKYRETLEKNFIKDYTAKLSEQERLKYVPFFMQSPKYGGGISYKNVVLMPKILKEFLVEVLDNYTDDKCCPVLRSKNKVIKENFHFLEKEKEKKFFAKMFENSETLDYFTNLFGSKIVSQMSRKGIYPFGYEIIRIDPFADKDIDNMLFVKTSHVTGIVKLIESADSRKIEQLKNKKFLLDNINYPKPARHSNILRLKATINPDSLLEIGITKEQSENISYSNFLKHPILPALINPYIYDNIKTKKYSGSKSRIQIKNIPSTNFNDLTSDEAEALIKEMAKDEEFTKYIEILNPQTKEQAIIEKDKYKKMSSFFVRMCATIKSEHDKLLNMGISEAEIALMKLGNMSGLVNDNNKTQQRLPKLNIHHVILRSFGREFNELFYEKGKIVPKYFKTTPFTKKNLVYIGEKLHNAYHNYLNEQIASKGGLKKGLVLKMIDFSRLGYVVDHSALMQKYNLPMKNKKVPQEKINKSDLVWEILEKTKNSR